MRIGWPICIFLFASAALGLAVLLIPSRMPQGALEKTRRDSALSSLRGIYEILQINHAGSNGEDKTDNVLAELISHGCISPANWKDENGRHFFRDGRIYEVFYGKKREDLLLLSWSVSGNATALALKNGQVMESPEIFNRNSFALPAINSWLEAAPGKRKR